MNGESSSKVSKVSGEMSGRRRLLGATLLAPASSSESANYGERVRLVVIFVIIYELIRVFFSRIFLEDFFYFSFSSHICLGIFFAVL